VLAALSGGVGGDVDGAGSTSSHCACVLDQLMNHKHSWLFDKPVDPEKLDLPDYFDKIKQPMDLGTVRTKLDNQEYHTVDDFVADVYLTFDNAVLYNADKGDNEGELSEVAKGMKEQFVACMTSQELMPPPSPRAMGLGRR